MRINCAYIAEAMTKDTSIMLSASLKMSNTGPEYRFVVRMAQETNSMATGWTIGGGGTKGQKHRKAKGGGSVLLATSHACLIISSK